MSSEWSDDSLDRDDRTWKERARIGTVEYDIETDTICFLHTPDAPSEEYFYWFYLRDIHTYAKYNEWFEHLGHKMWFTPKVKWNLEEVLERLGQCGNFEGIDYEVLNAYKAANQKSEEKQ